jgi:predicted dehydrogenase
MERMPENSGNGRGPFRGALIGLGNVAVNAHLPAWRKSGRFTIEAIVEPCPERAGLGKKLAPEARVYPSMEAMAADNLRLDFVDICTPPCFHAPLAVDACRSGMHVFCEKPLTLSPEHLRDIEEWSDRTQKVVFTVNNWKYAPLWVQAAKLIRENRIGALRSISLNVLRTPNSGGGLSDWRKCIDVAEGGILVDHGWHNLYLILSLLNEFPRSMEVKMGSSSGTETGLDETVDLSLRFREARASLHLTWEASCRRNFGAITGAHGELSVNDDHLVLNSMGSPPERFDFPEALSGGSHHPEWMDFVVENFSREITDPHRRGANLTEARWCSQLISHAYRSGRSATGSTGFRKVELDCCTP